MVGHGENLALSSSETKVIPAPASRKKEVDVLDQLLVRKSIRQHVRDLVGIFALVLFGLALNTLLRHRSLADALAMTFVGLVVIMLGYVFPRLMLPVWRAWMGLGGLLEKFVTTPMMWATWFVVLIPTAILARSVAAKLLDVSFRTGEATYWLDVPENPARFKLLERQY